MKVGNAFDSLPRDCDVMRSLYSTVTTRLIQTSDLIAGQSRI